MSRGQTTIVIVVAIAAIASVLAWRGCADDGPRDSSTRSGVDAGPAPARTVAPPRVVVASRRDGGARDLTLRAWSVDAAPLAFDPVIAIDGGELTVSPSSLAILGATRIEVGDGELRDLDVVIADADLVARVTPEPFATPEAAPGEPAGAVSGVVTLDGARVHDVTVELVQLATFGPGRPVVREGPPGATDDIRLPPRRFVGTSGVVRIDGLQPGSYVAIVHGRHRGARLVPATVTAGTPADISTSLPGMASIGGSVKNGLDDAPVTDAVVRLRVDGVVVRAAATDRRGVYLLDDVPVPGDAELELDAPGCTADPLPITLATGRTTRVIVATCP